MYFAALSLGSNQEPERYLRLAMDALRAQFEGAQISSAYRFPAVGFDGPDFINAAAVIATNLDPSALGDWLRALEDLHGRDRNGPRYSDRTLDIDIVLFDERVIDGPGKLRIPRDELRHAFVLKPLAEIAPQWLHPQSGQRMQQLWVQHPQYAEAFERITL